MRNVKVFTAPIGLATARIFGPLLRAKMSRRAETRMARRMRAALRRALTDTIRFAYIDGSGPFRTGRSKRKLLNGVRSFGTTFNGLRGHVMGPVSIAAHENGSTIKPKNAKALAIPLPDALRADGTPKLPGPNSWRITGSFIYKSRKTGRAYIARKNVDGKLVLLYALVDEVKLSKYKGFISKSWSKRAPEMLQEFGNIMMQEISSVNLLGLSRLSVGGGRRRRRK